MVLCEHVFFLGSNTSEQCEGSLISLCSSGEIGNYRLTQDNLGFSIIGLWGYRLSSLWSVYGGVQLIQANVDFIKDFVAEEVLTLENNRKILLAGGIVGFKVSTYSEKGFNYFLSLEYAPSFVSAAFEDKKIFSVTGSAAMGLSYQF